MQKERPLRHDNDGTSRNRQTPSSNSLVPIDNSPLRFLIITAGSVFVGEALIMVFLESIAPLGFWTTVLLDSLLILICTLPALYFWLYRPLNHHISERNDALKHVFESERRLKSHLQNTPVAVIEWNLDFEVVEWNTAAEKVFGYTKAEAKGRHAAGLLVPESAREHVNRVWSYLLENTGGSHSTNKNFTRDGRTIVCDWNNTPLVDESGKVCGVVSLVQDITERRQTEERVRLLLDNLPCVAMILKKGTREIVASNNAAHTIGAIPGKTCYETCASRQETCTFCQASEVWTSGETREIEVEYEGVWYHGIWVPLDDDLYVHYIFDITERKLAEQALQASEERFRTQMVQSPLVMEIYDLDGLQIEVNKAYEELWGFPASTTVNSFNVLKSKEVEEAGLMVYVKRAYAGEAVTVPEYVFDPTGATESGGLGRVRWLSTKIYPLRDSAGNVTSIVISHEDVTERKESEQARIESEQKLRMYISSAPDAIFIVDGRGRYLEVNEAACELSGYSVSDLMNMSIVDIIDPETRSESLAIFEKLKVVGKSKSEFRLKRKDGSFGWCSLDAVKLSEDRYMAFCSDVTETKRLRELESRAERLETAGTIAGQVAHDFNNLLAPLIAYPDFIREELPRDHPALAYLRDIENSAKQIAEINQQLLTLSRRGHYNAETLNLNEIIHQAVREMDARSDTLIIRTDLCGDIMNVRGGGAQLHRAINNLLHNAIDAMQGIGQITVKTENYYVDEVSVAYGRVPKGEFVKLTISDTGCGIPDDTVQKIFDPFFTTKVSDKKRGSGLGLSVVDAVVKDHGGYLDLSTRIGVGTSFYLYLPVTRESADEQQSEKVPSGTESILVVDDDDTQRRVSSQILEVLGYQVTTADSGEKVLEILKENPQDLLVLDMIMPPGIDGTETYRRALEITPNQRAIIVSGFSSSERVIEAQRLGAGVFVKKPFTKRSIAEAVRTELDKRVEIPAGE